MSADRGKVSFWLRLCVVVIYPTVGVLFRRHWYGLEHIPSRRQGGAIIVANHTSLIDPLVISRIVWEGKRKPEFMIKSGVFTLPFVGKALRGAGQIPVHRGTAEALQSIKDAAAALKAGGVLVVFPEGTVTKDPDQWPMQAKTGIARIILQAPDVPVIPIGQWGAQTDRTRRGLRLFTRRTSTAIVGEPLDLSRFRGAKPSASILREITGEVMDAVRDLVSEARGEAVPENIFVPSA